MVKLATPYSITVAGRTIHYFGHNVKFLKVRGKAKTLQVLWSVERPTACQKGLAVPSNLVGFQAIGFFWPT